jgi:hypothetical protein
MEEVHVDAQSAFETSSTFMQRHVHEASDWCRRQLQQPSVSGHTPTRSYDGTLGSAWDVCATNTLIRSNLRCPQNAHVKSAVLHAVIPIAQLALYAAFKI